MFAPQDRVLLVPRASDWKYFPGLADPAGDRVAWRATLKAGQPPDEYGARPPTPAAQPLACTRARRSTAAETNSAIDRSVRALRDVTNIV